MIHRQDHILSHMVEYTSAACKYLQVDTFMFCLVKRYTDRTPIRSSPIHMIEYTSAGK